jgi:hypothetical protein
MGLLYVDNQLLRRASFLRCSMLLHITAVQGLIGDHRPANNITGFPRGALIPLGDTASPITGTVASAPAQVPSGLSREELSVSKCLPVFREADMAEAEFIY